MSPVQPPLPAVPPPTRQLPLVPPPSGPVGTIAPDGAGSPDPGAAPAAGAVPTGPVDWMPLPPEPGAVPPGPYRAPAGAQGSSAAAAGNAGNARAPRRRVRVRLPAAPRSPRGGRGGRGTAAVVLGAVALLLLELGLVMHQAATTLWARVPLWAGFATVAAVVGLASVAGLRATSPVRDRAWGVGAGGLTGLAVFWVLVVLPGADTDRGFVLTAALASLGGCLWLTAGRGRTARPDQVVGTRHPETAPAVTERDDAADDAAPAPEDEASPAPSQAPSPTA